MPSVAEEPRLFPPGKKRRRDDDEARSLQYKLQSHGQYYNQTHQLTPSSRLHYPKLSQQHPHNDDTAPFLNIGHVQRKTLPIPSSKRLRTSDHEETMEETHQNTYTSHGSVDHDDNTNRPRDETRSPQSARSPDPTIARPPASRVNSGALLDPCHICRRKPTKKSDLDSYADCEGCQARTCFICLRRCPGWTTEYLGPRHDSAAPTDQKDQDTSNQDALSRSFHMDDVDDISEAQETAREGGDDSNGRKRAQMKGQDQDRTNWWASGDHRQVVCSRCCIEKGTEGDIACLGCLSRT